MFSTYDYNLFAGIWQNILLAFRVNGNEFAWIWGLEQIYMRIRKIVAESLEGCSLICYTLIDGFKAKRIGRKQNGKQINKENHLFYPCICNGIYHYCDWGFDKC